MSFSCQPIEFSEIPGWREANVTQSFEAFLKSARYHLENKPYAARSVEISMERFSEICQIAMDLSQQDNLSSAERRTFFTDSFQPNRIVNSGEPGLVTGYYEPVVEVSLTRDKTYRFPFYRQPDDLKDISNETDRLNNIPEGFQFARQCGNGFEIHPDRRQIDEGYLENKGLEIAYAALKADVYFTHIQGSACLIDQAGQKHRITYAAKTGHPYTSIGKILVQSGEIAQSDISMDAIRDWMEINPSKTDEVLWQNQSYIFFEELPDSNISGPIGGAKIPLTPGYSLAIDKQIYPFGLPIFVASGELDILGNGKSFHRLMIAQDTGSAIKGAERGDIFVGQGQKAGFIAGNIRHEAEFYVFLPRDK